MKSLFPRIFVSFWIAMTLIGAAFALIYLASDPSTRFAQRRNLIRDTLTLEAQQASDAVVEGEDPSALLAVFHERTGLTLFLVDDADRAFGPVPAPAAVATLARQARASRTSVEGEAGGDRLRAFLVERDDGTLHIAVSQFTRPSPWARAIGADTLPLRLLVVFLVAGLVSLLLARYLTRPLRSLRHAAQRVAEGDLSARVMPELGATDAEITALGRDFDAMASRVEQLVHAQQRLLEDVSHELRSPLARLRVALELARQRSGRDIDAPLDRIEREAERLGALIGEILTLTRLENDVGPAMAPVDLAALLEDVVRDADFEARERRVVLAEQQPVTLHANEEILRRATENIVRNAVRFAPPDTEVTVTLRREGSHVVVRIRDRGPGVPAHALRDIFVPLYRVEHDRDRKTGGAGLGLAIAHRAVTVHQGTVHAENAEDGGLLVVVRLPLRLEA